MQQFSGCFIPHAPSAVTGLLEFLNGLHSPSLGASINAAVDTSTAYCDNLWIDYTNRQSRCTRQLIRRQRSTLYTPGAGPSVVDQPLHLRKLQYKHLGPRMQPPFSQPQDLHPALAGLLSKQALLKSRFKILEFLDCGGFATVFKCIDILSNNKEVAAKIVVDAETDEHGKLTHEQEKNYKAEMKHEHTVYRGLKGNMKTMPAGVPATYCSGAMVEADSQHPKKLYYLSYLVMELLGPRVGYLSLDIRVYKHNVALLVNHGLCMLQALQSLHERGLVHRDIKPDNYCMPYGYSICTEQPTDRVYILDMGMAMEWKHKGFSWDEDTYIFYGTVDYSSVRTLKGLHPTPKDDLEGLACTLLEMATGNTPFDLMHRGESSKPLQPERLRQMADQKGRQWSKMLAEGSTPGFIKRWMRHLRSLPTQQTLTAADYDTLKGILLSALPRNHMATSAWSCAATLKRTEGLKRLSPEAPRGSNMQSCVSETATAVQSKRFRQQEEDDQEEYSMACGVTLMGSPEE